MNNHLVLKSKLIRPKLNNDILYRPQIQEKFQLLTEHPLVLLTASAGYGKTTSLLQYLNTTEYPCGWYSPGPEDDNIYSFCSYLIAALESIVPGIEEWYLQNMSSQDKFDWKRALAIILSGLEDLDKKVIRGILVIDDWHYLQGIEEINLFFNRFILCKPTNLHIVLLSRENFSLPAINRLRAEGKVLELDNAQLAFQYEEIYQFFECLAPNKFTPEQISKVFEYTEGWVMAIKLILSSNSDSATIIPHKNFQVLFEYLASDLFENLNKDMQKFMLISSIPEYITLNMMKEISSSAARYLKEIVNAGLFLSEISTNQYRYHNLFRDFLYSKAEEQLADFQSLHNRIAHYYLQRGENENALTYFLKGQAWKEAEILFVDLARDMVASGRGATFRRYLQVLPVRYHHKPEIFLARGDEARYACLYHDSLTNYQKAAEIFKENGNRLGLSQAYLGMSEVYLDTIEPKQAQVYLRMAYKALGEGKDTEKAKILGLMAENMVNQGKPKQAERYHKLTISKFINDDTHNLEPRLKIRTGRLQDAIKYLERQINLEIRLQHVPNSYRETSLLLSFSYSLSGEIEKALAAAEEGINLGKKIGSPMVTAVGYIRCGHALLLYQRSNNREDSRKAYEKALEQVERFNIVRIKTEVMVGQCLLNALEGDWQAAQECGLKGIAITEKVQDQWFTAVLQHSIGMAATICGKYDVAQGYLQQGGKLFERCGDSLGKTWCNWWLSYLYLQTQNYEDFAIAFSKLLELTKVYNYNFILEKPTLFGDITGKGSVHLLSEGDSMGLLPEHRQLIINLNKFEQNERVLKIYTLGGLNLQLGEKEISIQEWRRKSSLRLFCLFLTKRQYLLNKENIMFSLWPDADNDYSSRNFKSALNNLLNILEPDRKPWGSSYYIQRKGTTYYFNLASNFWLDIDDFEKNIEIAFKILSRDPQEAEKLLVYALSLYNGGYLEGVCQDEWCLEEKDRLDILYIKAAEALANIQIEKGAYEEALKTAKSILGIDPCWEASYQLIMRCYGKMRNHVMVTRTFIRCQEILDKELAVKPSSKTRQIFHNCIETSKEKASS
ncbi:MAG: BTAD domain-containing putative transcriptional regulator [Peptococcia bacterium]